MPADALSRAVTAEYARRGWPTSIPATGKDGGVEEMGYIVVDFADPAGRVAQVGTEIAEALNQETRP